jgi:anaerobic glycerol-3-phosphate dehydrogenase
MHLEGLDKFKKKLIHLIGSRTRDLPACSIAFQPSTLGVRTTESLRASFRTKGCNRCTSVTAHRVTSSSHTVLRMSEDKHNDRQLRATVRNATEIIRVQDDDNTEEANDDNEKDYDNR